jgi:hypothetical protein
MGVMLRSAFYWYGVTRDIQQWIDSCAVCRGRKAQNTRAPLEQDNVSYCRERVFLDVKGPLPVTARGHRHYVVCVDGFSKYCVLYPVSDLSASTLWSGFYNHFVCRLGAPVSLHTDGYSSLVESTAKELFGYLNIFKTRTTPYHPPSDGQSERFVRSTLDVLSKVMAEQTNQEWDELLPKVELALNTTLSTTTNLTPYFIEHGQEAILPADLVLDNLPAPKEVGSAVRELQETHICIFRQVRKATGRAQRRQKSGYDLRVEGAVIEVGDMVLYRKHELRPGEAKSFKMAYREPLYTVVEKLSDVNYRISGSDIENKVVHYNNILRVDAPDRSMATAVQTRGVAIPPADERPRRERRPPPGLQDYIVDPIGSKVA